MLDRALFVASEHVHPNPEFAAFVLYRDLFGMSMNGRAGNDGRRVPEVGMAVSYLSYEFPVEARRGHGVWISETCRGSALSRFCS